MEISQEQATKLLGIDESLVVRATKRHQRQCSALAGSI